MKKQKAWVILLMAMYLGLSVAAINMKGVFYLNLSPSEPQGVYRVSRFDGELRKGSLVILEVPEKARPYVYGRKWLTKGMRLLKNIAAAPEDEVWIDDKEIRINGRYVGPVATQDSAGLPLPRLRGWMKIKRGYFLPIATHSTNSFDGRYFGPISIKLIRGKAKAVITF